MTYSLRRIEDWCTSLPVKTSLEVVIRNERAQEEAGKVESVAHQVHHLLHETSVRLYFDEGEVDAFEEEPLEAQDSQRDLVIFGPEVVEEVFGGDVDGKEETHREVPNEVFGADEESENEKS